MNNDSRVLRNNHFRSHSLENTAGLPSEQDLPGAQAPGGSLAIVSGFESAADTGDSAVPESANPMAESRARFFLCIIVLLI